MVDVDEALIKVNWWKHSKVETWSWQRAKLTFHLIEISSGLHTVGGTTKPTWNTLWRLIVFGNLRPAYVDMQLAWSQYLIYTWGFPWFLVSSLLRIATTVLALVSEYWHQTYPWKKFEQFTVYREHQDVSLFRFNYCWGSAVWSWEYFWAIAPRRLLFYTVRDPGCCALL